MTQLWLRALVALALGGFLIWRARRAAPNQRRAYLAGGAALVVLAGVNIATGDGTLGALPLALGALAVVLLVVALVFMALALKAGELTARRTDAREQIAAYARKRADEQEKP